MNPAEAITFDDTGEPVPSEGFDYDAIDQSVFGAAPKSDNAKEQDGALFKSAVHELAARSIIEILTTGATPIEAGRRAFMMASLLKIGGTRTQREMADLFGLSLGAVNKAVNNVKEAASRINIDETLRQAAARVNIKPIGET